LQHWNLDQNAEGGWPFSSFSSSSFSLSSSSSIVVGPFEAMKMGSSGSTRGSAAVVTEIATEEERTTVKRWGGEGGGGGDGGGRQPWKMGRGIVAIAVDCSGGARNQHLLGAPAKRGEERQGQVRGAPRQGYLCGNNWQPAGNCCPARGTRSRRGGGNGSGRGLRRQLRGFNGSWFHCGGIARQTIVAATGQRGETPMAIATATTRLFFAVDP
jgi:hypothetical protein